MAAITLQVVRMSATATLPVRGSALAAGYDLASAVDCVIPARGKGIVKTDLAISVPEGTYGRIAPRSQCFAYPEPAGRLLLNPLQNRIMTGRVGCCDLRVRLMCLCAPASCLRAPVC